MTNEEIAQLRAEYETIKLNAERWRERAIEYDKKYEAMRVDRNKWRDVARERKEYVAKAKYARLLLRKKIQSLTLTLANKGSVNPIK
jgi:predicted  nucleic acid-binding Zn-ribbon protein